MPAPVEQMAAAADPMVPRWHRVQRHIKEIHDTFTLELAPEDGGAIPEFKPGQFNMLYVFGLGECAISISGDPERSDVLLHTTRHVGRVTGALRRQGAGGLVGIRGPFGRPWPIIESEGNDIVVIAGGIGLAPLRPVFYHLMSHRGKYGRAVLLYGARTPKDILFRKELQAWSSHLDIQVLVTVDHAGADWHGNVGVVTHLIRRAPFDPSHATALVCGPEVMMKFAVQGLLDRGVAADAVYVSMERNMKCALGFCGHCQFGPEFVCRDGPVFPYSQIRPFLDLREF
jgi:NAD(P)H-flavin reductase